MTYAVTSTSPFHTGSLHRTKYTHFHQRKEYITIISTQEKVYIHFHQRKEYISCIPRQESSQATNNDDWTDYRLLHSFPHRKILKQPITTIGRITAYYISFISTQEEVYIHFHQRKEYISFISTQEKVHTFPPTERIYHHHFHTGKSSHPIPPTERVQHIHSHTGKLSSNQ